MLIFKRSGKHKAYDWTTHSTLLVFGQDLYMPKCKEI